jgi:hypothetical protein
MISIIIIILTITIYIYISIHTYLYIYILLYTYICILYYSIQKGYRKADEKHLSINVQKSSFGVFLHGLFSTISILCIYISINIYI